MGAADKFHGLLLIDKPLGITSHDVVDDVRRLFGQRSVGHTGTLDPLAEGLLVLCLGNATKLANYFTDHSKSYEAELCLGTRSTTYDAEGVSPKSLSEDIPPLTEFQLETILDRFRGMINQQVPPHSAVQVDGERLYDLARRGETFIPPTRQVEITTLRVDSYDKPFLRLHVECSKGTYIRSLAHDIGNAIGCGAYLSQLRRTSVGAFNISNATSLAQLRRMKDPDERLASLVPMESALNLGAIRVTPRFSSQVIFGQVPRGGDVLTVENPFRSGEPIFLKDCQGRALAIATASCDSEHITPHYGEPVLSYLRVFA